MFSSNNNGIGSFSPSFPLPTSLFGHETLLIPPSPNFLQNDFPNFFEAISNGQNGKHICPSYESDLLMERSKQKKDMHRKIHTARGPRERRVRLSLNVAQKFFDLQDMLGFDKASKTLDWLLGKSNFAIEELKRVNNRYVSSISDCEKSANCACECEVLSDQTIEDSKVSNMNSDFRHNRRSSKSSLQLVGRESRSKARERARKRTKEKMGGATMACDIVNQIEGPKYNKTMMVNCFLNEQDPYITVSQAQGTRTIADYFSVNNMSLIKPFSNLSTASSSINYQHWANIGALVPQSQTFSYFQSAPLEAGFQDR